MFNTMPVCKLGISCPSDIDEEIKIVYKVVEEINNSIGMSLNVIIMPMHWLKNTTPQSGNHPQNIVNEQVFDKADAIIAIFDNKLGTPTLRHDSGTIEEIEDKIEQGKQVFLYFSDKPVNRSNIDVNEEAKIQQFKQKYANQGIYYNYKSNDDFEIKVRANLLDYIYKGVSKSSNQSANIKNNELGGESSILNKRKYLIPTKTYEDITKAHNDIANDIKEGSFLKFYGLRGATFTGSDEVNAIVRELKLKLRKNSDIQVKFLISYPFSEEIRHRLKALPEYADEEECENKWRDTYQDVSTLTKAYQKYNKVQVHFHDTPLIFRLIFTEQHLYMGYYEPGINSVYSAIYQFEAGTSTYQTYNSFFDYQWVKSRRSIPSKIPPKYSFLSEKFSVAPSLVINTTSLCNMECMYCPEGGENLSKIQEVDCISANEIKRVVQEYEKHMSTLREASILRITGGEPLIDSRNRKKVAQILGAAKHYKRIVLCTNGVFWKNAYEENFTEWENVKSVLLLKISLDTLKEDIFCDITGTGERGKSLLKKTIDNIKYAKKKGFKIELNLVATKENLRQPEDVLEVFEFARKLGLVGVKVLTVNDFGGVVKVEQSVEEQMYINDILQNVIIRMQELEYEERKLYLNDNKGIEMRRFVAISDFDEECTLTIVDHHNESNSITPRRTFSEFCYSCKYYPESDEVICGQVKPCATGIMSLTLRSDGLLSPCRLRPEKGRYITNIQRSSKIQEIVNEELEAFGSCFHRNV